MNTFDLLLLAVAGPVLCSPPILAYVAVARDRRLTPLSGLVLITSEAILLGMSVILGNEAWRILGGGPFPFSMPEAESFAYGLAILLCPVNLTFAMMLLTRLLTERTSRSIGVDLSRHAGNHLST